MRRRLLAALLLAALGAGAARGAPATTPPTGNSTVPPFIRLVGADALGRPDSAGTFTVVVRDLANNPVAGSRVVVDFGRATDLRLCAAQAPGLTFVLDGVLGVTDSGGRVSMTLLGHGVAAAAPSAPQSVRVYADGVLLGHPSASAFDLDGAGGVAGADLSLWLADFASGANPARADYDGNGWTGGGDLSLWLGVFTRGGSARSCPPVVTAPD